MVGLGHEEDPVLVARLVAALAAWDLAQPDPGIALNPPVPQPQLTKQLPSGVVERMGERSPVISTIPPHCRSILSREIIGKVSTSARTVSPTWWKLPRCV